MYITRHPEMMESFIRHRIVYHTASLVAAVRSCESYPR
jgi:hypothetical protein